MIKRVLKRFKLERLIAQFTGAPPATIMTIIRLEWFKFHLRRRATSSAMSRYRWAR